MRTAQEQCHKYGNLMAADHREILSKALSDNQIVLRETGHWGPESKLGFLLLQPWKKCRGYDLRPGLPPRVLIQDGMAILQ